MLLRLIWNEHDLLSVTQNYDTHHVPASRFCSHLRWTLTDDQPFWSAILPRHYSSSSIPRYGTIVLVCAHVEWLQLGDGVGNGNIMVSCKTTVDGGNAPVKTYPYHPCMVYSIFTAPTFYICLIFMVNVGKLPLHGSYGIWTPPIELWKIPQQFFPRLFNFHVTRWDSSPF